MQIESSKSSRFEIEHVFAVGFFLLVPVFLLGVVATLHENGVGLTLSFGGFGAAGVVWIRQELPGAVARLIETTGSVGPMS